MAIVADEDGFHGLITRVDVLNYLRDSKRLNPGSSTMRNPDDRQLRRQCRLTPRACADGRQATASFATRAIHAGQSPDPTTGAVMTPIYTTSTYVQQSPGVHKGFDYGRSHNPTRFAFERCVADLEDGTAGFAFASGLAAIATVLELLDSRFARGRVRRSVRRHRTGCSSACAAAARSSISRYVDPTEPGAFEAAIRPNTRLIWIETPSNPLLKLADLAAIAQLAQAGTACSRVADNTFATPYVQRPLTLGFDIVVHSVTKYLNGHSDMIGGIAVVGDDDDLRRAARLPAKRRRRHQRRRSIASWPCAA